MIRVTDDERPRSLTRYRQKRDPGRTSEPFSPEPLASNGPPLPSRGTLGGLFVVHEHDASRRHFDLRLEVAGVLSSFAVPKGPSLDPDEKRLAIQTEDHPLGYADYEGVIPDDNYGAGAMIAWDLGRVRYLEHTAEEGLRDGKLDFTLHGYKLRGRFALVRTSDRRGVQAKQPQWLLIKKRDAFARDGSNIIDEAPESVLSGLVVSELEHAGERVSRVSTLARELGGKPKALDEESLVPMACASEGAPLHSEDYLYELKLDGIRILAQKRGEAVALTYRKGRTATDSFPDVVRALKALPFEQLVLDGEIVAFDADGRPNFARLAQRFTAVRARDVTRAMAAVPVSYLAFDVLSVEGLDLRAIPLVSRKRVLSSVLPPRGPLRALDHIDHDGQVLLDFCRAHKLEGVVAKRSLSPYRAGPRASRDWVKIKLERENDFVVVGYTKGKGSRALGALDLASYVDDRLVSRGKVGSGFDAETESVLLRELDARRVQKTDVVGTLEPSPQGRVFVRPELVVNVRHLGFTDAGNLRHPVFCGLRADVAPRDCTAAPHGTPDELRNRPLDGARAVPRPEGKRRVSITHPKKVFWPTEGYTKGDLCAYYEAIAPQLLPFLRERPVILVRYPDGIEGKSFYQWNAPRGTPSWVRTVRVAWPEREGKEAELFLIDDVDTLLHIGNLGCIPIHILAARIGTLSTCDFLTVDFDLGGEPLAHGVTLARELQGLLEELGLRGFPKTSGQTGLHVLVSLGPGVSFDTARTLCDLLGTLVTQRHREIATQERSKDRRGPRVYVDTGQTGTTRAIVSPYSVRAYPGARVSTPLDWDEVTFALDPSRFTIMSVPDRVAEHGCPMRELLSQAPDIHAAVARLAALLPRGG